MDYKKIDTFFMNSDIDNEMVKRANYDVIGDTKRRMANKLTDQAIHKHTSNVMFHFVFSVEDVNPETISSDLYRVFTNGYKKIRAKLEVFEANE
jgi:hypothetical protein